MADIPTPRSYAQTLGDMFDAFLSKQGIKSLRVGGPIVSLLEAAAQSDMRNSQDIFNLLTSADLDNANGLALSRIGRNEGVPKLEITPATGLVNIIDSSFTKKATTLYQGAPAPIVGSVVIQVVDASQFPAPGPSTKIYIGRGTNNYEGPIRYTAVTNVGNNWQLTLATGTTKFHNTTETVILAQGGNRVIGSNTVVRTPQASVASAIEFRTLFQATLPDGETEVDSIQVVAQLGGIIGNVIAGAISEFATQPFSGATVTNPSPYTNGRETESDNDYRERIRDVRASRALATTLAIQTAVIGITAPDENKRINSASLVKKFGFPSTLYIDDGTGYEESTAAIAIESLMDDATGGETHFETTQRPIARAYAISTNTAPFVLRTTDQLSVKVGGVTYTHSFNAADFHSISNASAFEVVASINSNPDIAFVARTANQGTQVVIFANSDVDEDIEVIPAAQGTDANDGLALPAGVNYTMRLYKNDRILTKDGQSAIYQSLPFAAWDSITGANSFTIAVDGTPALTYDFVDQDFINANTGFATLGRNSLAAWAAVINAKIPGITATVNAGRLVLTSNAGPVAKAAISVIGGDLVTAHFFAPGSVQGRPRDYTLDRNEAQIVLAQVLEAGDRLTAGSLATRAFLEAPSLETISIDPALGPPTTRQAWWVVDGQAQEIQHGVTASTPLTFTISKADDFGNILTVSAPSAVFKNVQAQDWMILWEYTAPASFRGVHRIATVADDGMSLTIERHGSNLTSRSGHRSVLIPGTGATSGTILTCGGNIQARSQPPIVTLESSVGNIATAELYNHSTRTVKPAAQMNVARAYHTATVLANGKVVVVGGLDVTGAPLKSIETYDPIADTWTLSTTHLTTGREFHTATLLDDGRILIVGGDDSNVSLGTYQIYDPTSDTVNIQANLVHTRSRHCAVKLGDSTVLIAGGIDAASTVLATTERFTPGPDSTTASGSMTATRFGFAMGLVDATHIIAVGNSDTSDQNTWEIYNSGAGTWGTYTSAGNLKYSDKPAVKLTNGDVVGLDGWDLSTPEHAIGWKYSGGVFTNITSQPPSVTDLGGPRFDTQLVEIVSGDGTSIKNIIASIGGSFYHGTSFGYQPCAVLNEYNEPVDAWDAPDPAATADFTLPNAGIAFARTDAFVQETDVPSGANYTASSLADLLNTELVGASASVYKTTKLRVATNTFDATGDIALVAQDAAVAAIGLETGNAVSNLVPHLGSVMSRSSDLGTPSFEDVRVVSQVSGTPNPKPVVTSSIIGYDYALVGLRNWTRGGDGTSTYKLEPWIQPRANSNFQFATRLMDRSGNTSLVSTVETRDASVQPWGPWDRVEAAAPFAIGFNSVLDVLVDNDDNKRYPINMWRTLQTFGSTYSSTNTFKDGDAGGDSLSNTFDLNYDFNDMAVYMPSRAIAFSSDGARRMLFRYFRLGPDGDGTWVRFGNPDAENSNLTVTTTEISLGLPSVGHFATTIKLRSGALRTPTIHNTTRVGRGTKAVDAGGIATYYRVLNLPISSAQRTSNVTTVTLTLPSGITNHGISVTNKIWIASTDVNFSSGLKTVTAVTGTTLSYAETAANAGPDPNVGTLSFDSQGAASFTGSSVATKDFYRLVDPIGSTPYGNLTFQVSAVPGGGNWIEVLSGDQYDGSSETVSTTLSWDLIESTANFKLFANNPQTAGAIATAIATLQSAAGSTCPVTAKELGTGLNNIDQNSCDENDNSKFWYVLSDGINWVKTTISPISKPNDYSLAFKAPTNSSLATNADWENETVRIVPITAKNVAEWLNTPAITGLWTVANIQVAGQGHHVQIATQTPGSSGGITVQGGIANAVTAPVVGTQIAYPAFSGSTINLPDAAGLHTGMWCRIENETSQPKAGVFGPGLVLSGITADGLVSFTTPIAVHDVAATQLRCQFEKQGRFVAISDIGSLTDTLGTAIVTNDSFLRITPATTATLVPQVSAANQGIFRIVRFSPSSIGNNGGTIYIENVGVIEEVSECTLEVFSVGSVMPGDQLVVLDAEWGAGNVGIWDIKAVGETTVGSGDQFTVLTQFTIDTTTKRPTAFGAAPALTSSGAVYVREGTPAVYIMRVDGLSLNQNDGNFADIRWDQQVQAAPIGAAAGSVIQVLDKLDFPQDFASGADGYRYDVGLLREANKVVYGDPGDPGTYPGVAAADSHINIQGPLVKRIQIGLSIRVKTGLNTQDIANRVRSAVATVVNQTNVGESISFSDIIDAAREVVGVVSVAIVSPLFSVDHDQIPVQPYEKPYVLDLAQDVQVSFLGV